MQLASPSTFPACWYSVSARSHRARRAVMVAAFQGDVAQAGDAVGLAEHVPALLVQRQRPLVPGPRAVMVGAFQGESPRPPDAVGLAEHVPGLLVQRQRPLILGPGVVMIGAGLGRGTPGP